MKCVFIDIGYDCEELNEPLGIEVLESYLKKHAPHIQTGMHFSNLDGSDYLGFLSDEEPDIIAVSTHINTWKRWDSFYKVFVSYSENANKHIALVIGGIIATYEYDHLLQCYPDVICSIGEGEESILSICQLYEVSKNYSQFLEALEEQNCPNLVFFRKNQRVITRRSIIADLSKENIEVNHSYLNRIVKSGGLARMEASRGCPWNNCSFCVMKWKYDGVKWRPFSLDKVASEIIQLSNIGAEIIYFTDEDFIAGDYNRLERFINIINEYKQNSIINPKLEFVASTSIHTILYDQNGEINNSIYIFKRLKQIGFRSLFVGIESGSETQLKRFCKGISVSEIENALQILRKCDIEPDIGYIIFDPLMDLDELIEDLMFLERNNLHHQISRFAKRMRVVPFTKYCQSPKLKLKYYDKEQIEYSYSFNDISIEYIYKVYSEWEDYNVHRTHILQAQIRAMSTSSEKRVALKQKLASIRKKEFDVLSYLVNKVRVESISNFDHINFSLEARKIEALIEAGTI